MISKVIIVICFTTAYAAIAPGQNAYLPPKQPGYNYNKPSVPFPPSRPTPPSRPIPTTKPVYGPPKPFTPGPTPPPFRPSPGPQRPSFPSPPPQRPSFPSPPAQRPSYPSPPPQRPAPPTGPGYVGQPTGTTATQYHDDGTPHMPGNPFDFNYAVKDDQYGNDYSHNAISDGDVTKGEYRIQLPDGRTQIVKYTADWKTGFHAQVKFEGTPNYQARPSAPRPTQQFPAPQGPTGPARPAFPPAGPSRPAFPSGPARPAFPSGPARPSSPGYPSGPRPTPTFPSPSRPNQIPGQKYDTNGGYKY